MAYYLLKHAHDCEPHCHAAPGWLGPVVIGGIFLAFACMMFALVAIVKTDMPRRSYIARIRHGWEVVYPPDAPDDEGMATSLGPFSTRLGARFSQWWNR